jgi:WD40 repeat protein
MQLSHLFWSPTSAICFFIVANTLPAGAGDKTPVPAASEQEKSAKFLHKFFAEEYAKAAKSVAERKDLAAALRAQAIEAKESPSLHYAALKEAADLAARAGDVEMAFDVVSEMAQTFDVQAGAVKIAVLEEAVKAAAETTVQEHLARAALKALEQAIAKDDFETGARFVRIAQAGAAKTKNKTLLSRASDSDLQLTALKVQFESVKPSLDKLRDNPKDAAANTVVGKYLCLGKGNWEEGLPRLALSNDAELKALAERDLAIPGKLSDQLALGDAWWDLAGKAPAPAQRNLQRRAAHWYGLAYADLTGINKTKVERRFEMAGLEPPAIKVVVGHIRTFNGHKRPVQSTAISPDGKYIVSGGDDDDLRFWEVASGKEIKTFKGHASPVWSVAFSPDGKYILSAGEDMIVRLWDVDKVKEVRRFPGHSDIINRVAFSSDGKRAVSAGDDKVVRLWDVDSGQELKKFEAHTKPVWGAALSKDGSKLVTGGSDNIAIVWDVKSGKELKRFEGHTDNVLSVALSPDGKHAISAGSDHIIRMWEMATGKEIRKFEGHTSAIYSVAFSGDGKRIISSSQDKTVRWWDAASAKEVHCFEGHSDDVGCVVLSQDGRYAVSASMDMTVRLWGLPK